MSLYENARLLIDGELVSGTGGKTFDNLNPATEEVLGQVPDATVEDTDRAISLTASSVPLGAGRGVHGRGSSSGISAVTKYWVAVRVSVVPSEFWTAHVSEKIRRQSSTSCR